jgi:uncharacterized protein YndB with AHSA1/START domain
MKSLLISYKKEIDDDLIIESEWIHAPIEWVYKGITNSEWIDEWGGGPAKFIAKPGGKYFLWDGEIYGCIIEINKFNKIVFTLREKFWQENWKDSIVKIELSEERDGTRFNLKHSNFPNKKIQEKHKEGWGEYYIGPLKAYLENINYKKQKPIQKKKRR